MKIKKLPDVQQNDLGLPTPAVGLFPLQSPTVPHPSGKKILLLGDVPYEAFSKLPFSGASYGKLRIIAEAAGLDLRHCYIHNVLDFYPDGGMFSYSEGSKRSASLAQEIDAIAPDVIITLGSNAFTALFGDFSIARDEQHSNLEDERGFPRYFTSRAGRYLVVPTLHPTDLFLRHHYSPIVTEDIRKAVRLAQDGWKQPTYKINYWPSFDEVCATLDALYERKTYLSCDIETRGYFITCVGLAWTKTDAIVIPFHREGLKPYWTQTEERIVWRKLARVIEHCPLLGQNAVHFDTKVLMTYGIRANFIDDTMFASWQCYQELPKTLAFMLSLYTDLPYHKDILSDARKGKIDYKMEFYYCGIDCCSTFQVFNENLVPELKSRPQGSIDRYKFNIQMSRVFEYASGHGLPFDHSKRDARVKELEAEALDMEVSLNKALGRNFNVRSPKQVKELFYNEWNLPAKIKVKHDKETGEKTESETADYLTTLYLARMYPNLPQLMEIGRLRKLQKRISSLRGIDPDRNGLVYWDFSTVGTKTGRAAGKKPMNKHGCQPQNVDRRDRDLFLAPTGYYMLKADLEGADSWTQAAQLACMGDDRLMKDLLLALKPAQALAIARIYGDEMLEKPTSELLPFKKVLKSEHGEVIYRISKAVSHGSAYMMKKNTMHQNIFKQSDGELFVNPDECEKNQKLFYKRYNFPKVHEFMRGVMINTGYLDYSDGSRQIFLGRKDDATLREMLAAAPQAHTTRAANTTMLRIFHDLENRDSNGRLILRPINQVHDETDMLFPKDQLNFVADLFHKHCQVGQEFWGQSFTIPFEAQYGEHWGACKTDLECA